MPEAGLSSTVVGMNPYEITTIAGMLNDSLNRDPDLHRSPEWKRSRQTRRARRAVTRQSLRRRT
jgi:hypothetical protein